MGSNKSTQKTTFWSFLQNYDIEIPIIQRDYAQGRVGKESLRRGFLEDIKNALDTRAEMKLDFVYGSKENGCLYPLDGQQRLTTLWLLHWYIALMCGDLSKASSTLKKFSYETRISSREFCEKLCDPNNFKNFFYGDIVSYITSCTWFYSSWKQDPTIQAMLRMLGGTKDSKDQNNNDGIEQVFKCQCLPDDECCFLLYWNLLTNSDASSCPLVFFYLSLDEFKLTDDLYIKMNARGEQLTSFENFKADMIGYMQRQKELYPNDKEWDELLDPKEGLPILFDSTWTDIFWDNKSKGTASGSMSNHIDEIYFAFLNRFFWNELFIAKKSDNSDKYILDIGRGDENSTKENENLSYKYLNDSDHPNDYDKKIAYKGFDVYQYCDNTIPKKFFKKMRTVLNRYSDFSKKNGSIPLCEWDKDFHFIPEYKTEDSSQNNFEIINNTEDSILEVTTLNQVQRIVFFAVCKFFSDEGADDEKSLGRWMRVVWNLVSGEDRDGKPQIRSTQAMRTAIEFIESLNSHEVYKSLIDCNYDTTTEFGRRCKEERDKAKQILSGNIRSAGGTWEEVIIKAEQFAFFKGSIRFLFQDANGKPCWADFDIKWENSKKYFDKDGVKDNDINGIKYKTDAKLLKAVLYHVNDFWTYIECQKFVFDNNGETWKSNILLGQGWEKAVHKIMMNDLTIKERDEDCLMYKNLYNSNLLNYVAAQQTNSRIRLIHGHKGLYPPRYEGILLDDDNNHFYRNSILFGLLAENLITSNQKIDCCDFFKGWDINFYYIKDDNQFEFQWNTDNHVYLVENGKRVVKDNSIDEKYEKYYCFDASMIKEKVDFRQNLDELIKLVSKDKS